MTAITNDGVGGFHLGSAWADLTPLAMPVHDTTNARTMCVPEMLGRGRRTNDERRMGTFVRHPSFVVRPWSTSSSGRQIVNVLPCCSWLATSTVPPCNSTISLTTYS